MTKSLDKNIRLIMYLETENDSMNKEQIQSRQMKSIENIPREIEV